MKKLVCVLLLALLVLPSLAACNSGGDGKSITVFNWEDYINPDVEAMFEDETGYTVNYATFDTNEMMYAKLTRASGEYDVLIPSDYMIERLIKEDRLLALDHAKLDNFANTATWLQDPAFDPGAVYSVPYMWGTVGILYNTTMTGGEIDSWGAMWDTNYIRNVLMIDSFRDTMGVTLKYLGYDINTREITELEAARDKLIEQR
jgi:spermidine/putrescine transport system substrate-binding protein